MHLTPTPRKKKQFLNLWVVLFLGLSLSFQTSFLWAGNPDTYEPDNSYGEAQVVIVDPIVPSQQHTFHQYFDEDWLKFHCVQGGNYRIFATPSSGNSDKVIELYNTDGTSLLARSNNFGPGEGEVLGWKCPEEGYYFVRFTNNSAYFGTDISYTVSLEQWYPIIIKFNGFIQGKVTSNGVGLGGVKLEAGAGVGLSQVDGSYILSLWEGPVTVSIRKDGYYPKVRSVTVVANQTTQLNIALEKISTPSRPPIISGAPQTSAILNKLYSFVPNASDPDGDGITFFISNKPHWASFNQDNGMLVGTPSENDLGKYGPIVISISDSQGKSASLPPFTLEVKRIMFPASLLLLNKEM